MVRMNSPSSQISWLFILLCGSELWATGMSLEEPNCPRYFYEQQILRAQMKLEHRLDIIEEKNKQWQDDVKQNLNELRQVLSDFKTETLSMHDDIKTKITADVTEIKQSTSDKDLALEQTVKMMAQSTTTALEMMNRTFHEQLASIGGDNRAVIVFKARRVTDKTPSSGQRMIFSTVLINEGDGYDSSTGYFTAPVDGLYMFTVLMGAYSGRWGQMHIVAANTVIGTIGFKGRTDTGGESASGDGVAMLSKGDKVWIKSYTSCSSQCIYEDSDDWNTFTGVLLNSRR